MYWQVDNEGEAPLDETEWAPLGEAVSGEDTQLAAVALFERGIESHWVYGSGDVEDLRRVLEPETGGRLLVVRRKNFEPAWEAVQRHLKPFIVYHDAWTYLFTRSDDDVLRVLDFEEIWPPSVLEAARALLLSRGLKYPPHGASAPVISVLGFLLCAFFGPIGLFMRVRINWKDRMPSGGERPHYSNRAKCWANKFLVIGMVIWGMIMIYAIVTQILENHG